MEPRGNASACSSCRRGFVSGKHVHRPRRGQHAPPFAYLSHLPCHMLCASLSLLPLSDFSLRHPLRGWHPVLLPHAALPAFAALCTLPSSTGDELSTRDACNGRARRVRFRTSDPVQHGIHHTCISQVSVHSSRRRSLGSKMRARRIQATLSYRLSRSSLRSHSAEVLITVAVITTRRLTRTTPVLDAHVHTT